MFLFASPDDVSRWSFRVGIGFSCSSASASINGRFEVGAAVDVAAAAPGPSRRAAAQGPAAATPRRGRSRPVSWTRPRVGGNEF